MDSSPGFIQGAFILSGVCAGSLALAFVFVALCSRDKRMALQSYKDCPERAKQRKLKRYHARYFDELKAAQEACEDNDIAEDVLENLKDLCIEEETPVGLVRMKYNTDKESFEYYTDTRNIQYRTLDAVARSFCLAHGCPQLCVNYKEEFNQAKNDALKEREEEEGEQADSDTEQQESAPASESTSVFAKFKTYNARSNQPVKARTRIVTARANRFSFLGTIADFDKTAELESEKKTAVDPNMSYADFKKKEA